MPHRDPSDVVRDHLEPGEEILWSGKPDVDAAVAGYSSLRSVAGFVIMLVAILGLTYSQMHQPGVSAAETIRSLLAAQPMLPIGLAVLAALPLLLRVFKLDGRSRLRRHFASQAYGITDRRILVIEKDDVLSFAADALDRPILRDRSAGYADVIFATRRISSGTDGRTRDPIQLERRTVGFKALANANEVLARLEEWIEGEMQEAADMVSDFVAAREPDAEGPATDDFMAPSGTAALRHRQSRMLIEFPEEWSVRVRKKKKPFGKTFLDMEKWKEVGETDDWTLARIEGPGGCAVDVEVFETPLLADYDTMANSRLSNMAGKLIASDPAYAQHGMRGFTVTRRNEIQVNQSTGVSGAASVVTPFRHTILHDGTRQISIASKWPEANPELAAAVDLVVRSVRIE